MRIRLQILLTMMPVFIFLGVVLAALNYFTRRDEVEFAAREEIYATTVALAEFLSSPEIHRELDSKEPQPFSFAAPLRRVLAANPIGSVSLRSIEDGSVLWAEGTMRVPRIPTDSAGGLVQSRGKVLFSNPLSPENPAEGWSVAVAPLVTEEGPFALLAVEIDASRILAANRSILAGSTAYFGVTFLLGLLATGLTGRMITNEVKELRAATRSVAEGRYGLQVEPGFLGEFNDLSNTFNTMTILLEEILLRMKRAVIEGEQFRKPSDLASRFGEYLWTRGTARFGTFRLLAQRFGERPNGDFLGFWQEGGVVRIAMGRVLSSGDLDSTAAASAVLRLIDEEIKSGGSGFTRAAEIFHFKFWNLILWEQQSPEVEVFSYRFGQAVETKQRAPVNGSQPLNWHSLTGDGARRLGLILDAFRVFREEELAEGLSTILGDPAEGGVVVLLSD